MPRHARVDHPGALQHLTARGVNRCHIFLDDLDRQAFIDKAGRIFDEDRLDVLAWSLMANHLHLYTRSGPIGVSRPMGRLLSQYAEYFNKRHDRVGHLFQDRFHNVLIETSNHALEVVRYVPLNPLRAGIVSSIEELAAYEWTSFPDTLGLRPARLIHTGLALSAFPSNVRTPRGCYRQWVAMGAARGVDALATRLAGYERRQRSARPDSGESTEETKLEIVESEIRPLLTGVDMLELAGVVCAALGADLEALLRGRRQPAVSRARSLFAHLAAVELGCSGIEIASFLGVSEAAVSRARRRGRDVWDAATEGWNEELLATLEALCAREGRAL